MQIDSISHGDLLDFVVSGAGHLAHAERSRDVIAYIAAAGSFGELSAPPDFQLHRLSGSPDNAYGIRVAKDRWMTFHKVDEHTIDRLDIEDIAL
jgi:toxin HigB-1